MKMADEKDTDTMAGTKEIAGSPPKRLSRKRGVLFSLVDLFNEGQSKAEGPYEKSLI